MGFCLSVSADRQIEDVPSRDVLWRLKNGLRARARLLTTCLISRYRTVKRKLASSLVFFFTHTALPIAIAPATPVTRVQDVHHGKPRLHDHACQ
jgi:hypothetical protein